MNNEIQLVPSETLQEWQKLSDGKVIINQNDISILDNMSISSMDQWKSGAYNKELGTYEKDSNSICLKDLKKFSSSSTYQASVPEGFKLQVLELDEDNEVLRVVNLFDGADYMPRSDAASLAITIVTADGSKCSYSNYTALLECSTVSLIKE